MNEDFKCNVLIMGKTGAGKSTLLNYLCDSNLAQTGAGKPVTGEGIYEYNAQIRGQEVRIFDSWGIEAGKVNRWKALIDEALADHGVQKKMEDWFHSIIYCVQAGGGRVEEIDMEIIKKFLSEGYLLTVVLTKADQIDEVDESKLKSVILNEISNSYSHINKQISLKVISTCAEKKKTRGGETQPFGKEEVTKAILDGWKGTVMERLPKHVVARLWEEIDKWEQKTRQSLGWQRFVIENPGLVLVDPLPSIFSRDQVADLYEWLKNETEMFEQKLRGELMKTFLEESVTSCKKADASLKTLFGLDFDANAYAADLHQTTFWERLRDFLFPIFSIFKEKNQLKQDFQEIEDYLSNVVSGLKESCAKLEPQIASELSRIL